MLNRYTLCFTTFINALFALALAFACSSSDDAPNNGSPSGNMTSAPAAAGTSTTSPEPPTGQFSPSGTWHLTETLQSQTPGSDCPEPDEPTALIVSALSAQIEIDGDLVACDYESTSQTSAVISCGVLFEADGASSEVWFDYELEFGATTASGQGLATVTGDLLPVCEGTYAVTGVRQ